MEQDKTKHYVTKLVKIESVGSVNLVGHVREGRFEDSPNESSLEYWMEKFNGKKVRILIEAI